MLLSMQTMRILCTLFSIIMTLQALIGLSSIGKVFAAVNDNKEITILFTHDMHDNLLPFKTEQGGKIVQSGGYARLQSAINSERNKDPELLLLDAGDFSMGTLFQTLFSSDAPELRVMGQMGYDVATFGNHEFDYRGKGLADSLDSAVNSGDKLPQIAASNISFPTDKNGNIAESLTNLKRVMDKYGVKDYVVLERKGIKIGVFGLMGKEAASYAPMSEVVFMDPIKKAKSIIDILKNDEKVDLVICLSHSGTWTDKSKSEDEILAKKVPEIDVIISGHTHTKLTEPIIAGKTIIGSCGENSENLGIIRISQDSNNANNTNNTGNTGNTGNGDNAKNKSNNSWNLINYNLKPIDGGLSEDFYISQAIGLFKDKVQEKYLDKLGMEFDEVLANTGFNFVSASKIGDEHKEDTLGNLISDAYIYAVQKAEGSNYEPVTAAIVPVGTIRGSFVEGPITVSDAFNVSSLGISKDGMSGYPLISVYLTGKELKTACEVDASITPIMGEAQLYISGLSYSFNPKRLMFNKVTMARLQKPDGTFEEIDDKKLYRVVAGLYSAQMLSVVGRKSFGLLPIIPKTKDGSTITDFEAQIITNSSNWRNNEIKEWMAIAEYLKSFEIVGDIPQVPMYYSQTHGRKVVETKADILSILGNPNGIALAVYAVVAIVVILAFFIIYVLIRLRKSSRRKVYNWSMRI